jgi:hypothetical protein
LAANSKQIGGESHNPAKKNLSMVAGSFFVRFTGKVCSSYAIKIKLSRLSSLFDGMSQRQRGDT